MLHGVASAACSRRRRAGRRSTSSSSRARCSPIAVIIVVARLMGALFKRLRQPAGGRRDRGRHPARPDAARRCSPATSTPSCSRAAIRDFLKVIANVGLVIFMFIVGLELDMKLIRGKERVAGVISVSSIILPFGLGILLALGIHGDHDVVPAVEEVDSSCRSRCSSARRCRSPRSRCWPASSPTVACTAPRSARSRWPAPPSTT